MCFKKKRYLSEIYSKDRKTILLSAQDIDVLIALDRDGMYKDRLLELKDELLYISPRDNEVVFEMDQKIKEKIGDLKLVLNKNKDVDDENIFLIIDNIFVMIKERDAKELK